MRSLQVSLNQSSYTITIGTGLRHNIGAMLEHDGILPHNNRLYIVSDNNVATIYLNDVTNSIQKRGFVADVKIIPNGESSKSLEMYDELITDMITRGLDRQSVVLALGGGVVGDLAGFAAATFMRGVNYVHLPTTLLAHDSSIGGKVAINHPLGKNMLGAFHQPRTVIYDIETFNSLPTRELNSGFAEIIKEAWLSGPSFFDWLSASAQKLHDISEKEIEEAIFHGCSVKIDLVQQDVTETGVRSYLNFGHTVGHALEQVTDYRRFLHGEAVAIGMVAACRLSEKVYGVQHLSSAIEQMLHLYHLPTQIPADIDLDQIIRTMKKDKKSKNEQIRMILTPGIGSVELVETSNVNQLLEVLRSMVTR